MEKEVFHRNRRYLTLTLKYISQQPLQTSMNKNLRAYILASLKGHAHYSMSQ